MHKTQQFVAPWCRNWCCITAKTVHESFYCVLAFAAKGRCEQCITCFTALGCKALLRYTHQCVHDAVRVLHKKLKVQQGHKTLVATALNSH